MLGTRGGSWPDGAEPNLVEEPKRSTELTGPRRDGRKWRAETGLPRPKRLGNYQTGPSRSLPANKQPSTGKKEKVVILGSGKDHPHFANPSPPPFPNAKNT